MKFIASLSCLLLLASSLHAQKELPELRARLTSANGDSARLEAYIALSKHYQYSNADSEAKYLDQGLEEFTAKNYKFGMASIINLQGIEDGTHGRVELARKRYANALQLFEQINCVKGIGNVNNGLGVLDCRISRHDDAIKHFMLALKNFESIRDTDGIMTTYLKLGIANEQSNNLAKALEYYNKVTAIGEQRPAPTKLLTDALNDIGIVYAKMGDMKKGIAYFEQALSRTSSTNMLGGHVATLINLGIAYTNLHNEKKALEYYNQALEILKGQEMPDELARLLINKSLIDSKNDPAKGLATLKEALGIAQRIGNRLLQIDIYDDLTDAYEQLNDYKNALNSYRTLKSVADSVFNIEKAKEIANLQSVYELERSNAKVNELQELSRKNNVKRNIIIAVASVLALTLLLLLFVYRKTRGLNRLLSKREKELEQSNVVKDKVFSIIGHDLRGPVGNITVMMQHIRAEPGLTEDKQQILDTLIEHSKASTETLDKLLFWGQKQIKGKGAVPVVFNAKDSLKNSIRLIRTSAEHKKITIADQTPVEIMVFGDLSHFDFVLRNLLSNAVKFTYNNGIIQISADTEKEPGYVTFSLRDNGMGIDKENIRKIFEPFSLSSPGTANEKGTSIGLMLCHEFVTANGGKIWVESEQGKGAVFYFTFKKAG